MEIKLTYRKQNGETSTRNVRWELSRRCKNGRLIAVCIDHDHGDKWRSFYISGIIDVTPIL